MKKYLKTLSRVSRVLKQNISHLEREYLNEYSRLITHHGKKYTVERLKNYLKIGQRYALYQEIQALPFVKSDKDNFPMKLKSFRPWLRGEGIKPILALSVLRSVEDLRLPISKDLESVTNEGANPQEFKDLLIFIENWSKRILQPFTTFSLKYHMTFRNGPNGPALLSSDKDLGALDQEIKLKEALTYVSEVGKDSKPPDISYSRKSGGICSRISQFPEKSGKTRTIAVIDYYSQRALRPLHKHLMKMLRGLVSDGTYSHTKVGEYVRLKTELKEFTLSSDQSAATDRLPRDLSFAVLKGIIPDKNLLNALWTILTERTFHVSWDLNKVISYSVGQPMGAYASWPLFSLTHHAIIEYCLQGVPNPKHKYKMIGDDLVLNSESASGKYLELMESVGAPIDPSKYLVSKTGSQYSVAEVAKRIFLNGKSLTPLTPGILRNVLHPMLFNAALGEILDRIPGLPDSFPADTLKALFRGKVFDKVWLLSSNPFDGNVKDDIHPYWGCYDREAFIRKQRLSLIMQTTEKAQRYRQGFKESYPKFSGGGVDKPNATQVPDACIRASEEASLILRDQESKLREGLQLAFMTPVDVELDLGVEYLLDPTDPFRDPKDLRAFNFSTQLLETAKSLGYSTS